MMVPPPTSKSPVAACQYIYQPIRRTREPRNTDPQAPRATSQENMASLGPSKKKGGKPPRADNKDRKARLKGLEYLWGWGQELGFGAPSRLHPRPKRAAKITTTKR